MKLDRCAEKLAGEIVERRRINFRRRPLV